MHWDLEIWLSSEDHCLLLTPNTTWKLKITYNSSFRDSDAFFWSLQTQGMQMAHIHTHKQNAHTHKIIKQLKNKDKPNGLSS